MQRVATASGSGGSELCSLRAPPGCGNAPSGAVRACPPAWRAAREQRPAVVATHTQRPGSGGKLRGLAHALRGLIKCCRGCRRRCGGWPRLG